LDDHEGRPTRISLSKIIRIKMVQLQKHYLLSFILNSLNIMIHCIRRLKGGKER
jgi:hypothetical protein